MTVDDGDGWWKMIVSDGQWSILSICYWFGQVKCIERSISGPAAVCCQRFPLVGGLQGLRYVLWLCRFFVLRLDLDAVRTIEPLYSSNDSKFRFFNYADSSSSKSVFYAYVLCTLPWWFTFPQIRSLYADPHQTGIKICTTLKHKIWIDNTALNTTWWITEYTGIWLHRIHCLNMASLNSLVATFKTFTPRPFFLRHCCDFV